MQFRRWLESDGLDRVWVDHPMWGRETVGEFLARHRIVVGADGKFTLYHGRPGGSEYKTLRPGTYLAIDPESAKFFAARDRGLNPETEVEVLELRLSPDDIDPGIHITLRKPYQL